MSESPDQSMKQILTFRGLFECQEYYYNKFEISLRIQLAILLESYKYLAFFLVGEG
jgi:hypothetical protein